MEKQWDPRTTYRVRQLPSNLEERSDAVALLVRLNNSLGPAANILLLSLTFSVRGSETNRSKTATVRFRNLPDLLNDDRTEWVLPAREAGYPENIIIDTHFLDLTVLSSVNYETHMFDCIAISGLASHPFGSWRSRGSDPNFMWLRDKLPRDIPSLRSIIYGYDTHLLLSTSIQTVDDLARLFLIKLEALNQSPSTNKPIIFLAHSLGGVILKRAIVLLANSADTERGLLAFVKAIVLFGVPSDGMCIDHLLHMVKGQPNEALISTLSPQSEYLKALEEQFIGITTVHRIRIISIYETRISSTAHESEDGTYKMNGPEKLLVVPQSAKSVSSAENDRIPLDCDHSNLIKFAEDDHNYQAVLNRLYAVKRDIIQYSDDQYRQLPFSLPTRHFRQSEEEKRCQDMEEMMTSLEKGVSDDRYREIEAAHDHTLEWVFEDRNIRFAKWLQNSSDGAFWIQGKPGSGKSTLLKYILQNPRTTELLNQTGSEEKVVCISYFFHNRGSYFQKSFEGLYRNTIHQMLKKAPELQEMALPAFYELKGRTQRDWTMSNLEKLYDLILDQNSYNITFVLFLDALDEYDGPTTQITDFVQRAAKMDTEFGTKVKTCFSSRPSNHFLDRFGSCLGFKIHDHTVGDIRRYITQRLKTDPVTHLLGNSEDKSSSTNLINSIADRAEGVFLWVRLIMDDVLKASADGSTFEELTEIVLSSPIELEDLYLWTIKRIPLEKKVRLESYIIFEIVLRSLEPLALSELADCLAVASITTNTIKDSINALKQSNDVALTDRFERKLKSCCGGLIEIVRAAGRDCLYVQFMHQTVKDFVGRPGFQQQVCGGEHPLRISNGHTFLSKYFLTLLFTGRDWLGTSEHRETLRDSFTHAFLAESTTGKSQQDFLDNIEEGVLQQANWLAWSHFRFKVKGCQAEVPSKLLENMSLTSVTAMAAFFDLKLYVKEKLQRGVHVIKHGRYLLHYALANFLETGTYDMSEMIELILSHGADKDQQLQGITPFRFLFHYFESHIRHTAHASLLRIARVFLRFGQAPDTIVDLKLRGVEISCPILHIAPAELATMLLEYGANVNALDRTGCTPLDWSIFQVGSRIAQVRAYHVIYKKILLLLDSGGRVTKCSLIGHPGKTPLDFCIAYLSKYFRLDKRIMWPEILDEPSAERVTEHQDSSDGSTPRKRRRSDSS